MGTTVCPKATIDGYSKQPRCRYKHMIRRTGADNQQGTAGNVGMYASGIPLGYMVDKRGPHLNTVLGAFMLAAGYYPLVWGMCAQPKGD